MNLFYFIITFNTMALFLFADNNRFLRDLQDLCMAECLRMLSLPMTLMH